MKSSIHLISIASGQPVGTREAVLAEQAFYPSPVGVLARPRSGQLTGKASPHLRDYGLRLHLSDADAILADLRESPLTTSPEHGPYFHSGVVSVSKLRKMPLALSQAT